MRKLITLTLLIILFFSLSCLAEEKIEKSVKKQNFNKRYYLGMGMTIVGAGILRYGSTDLYKKNMALGMNVSDVGFLAMAGGTELTLRSLDNKTYRNLYHSGLALASLGFLMNFMSTKNEKLGKRMMISGVIISLSPGIIEKLCE